MTHRLRIRRLPGVAAAAVLLLLAGCGPQERGVVAQPPAVEEGQLGGAAFRIELPADWNGDLVMYAHGYQAVGVPDDWRGGAEPVLREFLDRGFAVAWSNYRAQGWAVEEGIEDTEALRRYFVTRYGRPGQTFVTGHSMGGLIALAVLERYSTAYDGALPLCGPLAPALEFLGRVFDMVVLFEYFFPGSIGPAVDIPPDVRYEPRGSEQVRAAVLGSPERAAAFARRFEMSAADLPPVLSLWRVILRDLQERLGGNAFDNRATLYSGFDDDAAVNRGVGRYDAEARAVAHLGRYYTPTGRIADPVLAVHTTYDPIVPARHVNRYAVTAGVAGGRHLFAAQFVDARGHCAITPAQTLTAFDALLTWVRDYRRPASVELR